MAQRCCMLQVPRLVATASSWSAPFQMNTLQCHLEDAVNQAVSKRALDAEGEAYSKLETLCRQYIKAALCEAG
eukprot:1486085-Prymnesium_polylepis.1